MNINVVSFYNSLFFKIEAKRTTTFYNPMILANNSYESSTSTKLNTGGISLIPTYCEEFSLEETHRIAF